MPRTVYRYEFPMGIPFEEIEATLLLGILAVESLHGEVRVRLDSEHEIDPERRVCILTAADQVGRDLNRLFTGFLSREFGPDSFRVELIESASVTV